MKMQLIPRWIVDTTGDIIDAATGKVVWFKTGIPTDGFPDLVANAPELYEAAKVQQECGFPSKVTMYDEDGCEGWLWSHPDGREWEEIGDWSEQPTLHPLMRAAIAKIEGGNNE